MDLLSVILISLIEGITELLPISSTGHMVIASSILGIQQTDVFKSFEIFIQFGAILPLVLILKKEILNLNIWKKVIVVIIPILVIGYLFKDFFESLFNPLIVSITSIIGGIIFILIKEYQNKKIEHLNLVESFKIGIFQILSLFPGFSRSGACIIGGLFQGLKYEEAAKFSFLVGIPVLFIASTYSVIKEGFVFNGEVWLFLLGFIISFITSYIFTRWFLEYLKTRDLKIFGYYRIFLGVVIILMVVFNVI